MVTEDSFNFLHGKAIFMGILEQTKHAFLKLDFHATADEGILNSPVTENFWQVILFPSWARALGTVSQNVLSGRTTFHTFMISSHFFCCPEWQDHSSETLLNHWKLVSTLFEYEVGKNRARYCLIVRCRGILPTVQEKKKDSTREENFYYIFDKAMLG